MKNRDNFFVWYIQRNLSKRLSANRHKIMSPNVEYNLKNRAYLRIIYKKKRLGIPKFYRRLFY